MPSRTTFTNSRGGFMWTSWKSTGESTRSCLCAGTISNVGADWGWMDWEQLHREGLENTGEWELDLSWQCDLQPRKPTVSWAKRVWPVCWMEGGRCETPPDKLNPVVGLLVQERHEPAGMASVKGCEDCQRSRTLLWRKAETVGRV